MASTPPSLRRRLFEDLRSGSLAVIVTGVVLALPAAYLVTAVTHSTSAGFLVLITVGVVLPQAHERHWPAKDVWYDIGWTIVATAIVVAVYLVLFWGFRDASPLGTAAAAVGAFLVVAFGGLAVLAWFGPGTSPR